MKRLIAVVAGVGLLGLAGCSSVNLNLGAAAEDVSAGTSVDSSGNVGVNAGASKTLDTGSGTETTIGATTGGSDVNLDANVNKTGE